jgi:uncharacterized membrane protein YraQ (UPF0718 family)
LREGRLLRKRLLLGGLASAGVILAHALAFFFAAPEGHERAELLAATGHERWTLVVAVAMGLFVAGVAGAVLDVRRDSPSGYPSSGRSWFRVVPGLAGLQVAGFICLEVLERILSGHALDHLVTEPAVALGVVLQLVVAVLGGLLLHVLFKAIAFVLRTRALEEAQDDTLHVVASVFLCPRQEVGTGAGTLRGPPHRLGLLTTSPS